MKFITSIVRGDASTETMPLKQQPFGLKQARVRGSVISAICATMNDVAIATNIIVAVVVVAALLLCFSVVVNNFHKTIANATERKTFQRTSRAGLNRTALHRTNKHWQGLNEC